MRACMKLARLLRVCQSLFDEQLCLTGFASLVPASILCPLNFVGISLAKAWSLELLRLLPRQPFDGSGIYSLQNIALAGSVV